MYQKFRLDDTDESAEIHFLGIVEESVRSIFSDYTDIVHKYAAYFRKWYSIYKYIKINYLIKINMKLSIFYKFDIVLSCQK